MDLLLVAAPSLPDGVAKTLDVYPPLVLLGTFFSYTGLFLILSDDVDDFLGLWLFTTLVYPGVLVWYVDRIDVTSDFAFGYSLRESTVAFPLLFMALAFYIFTVAFVDRYLGKT
ncbi:hypothetical protein C457_14763 [Haloferax prahovense DSM 18310]|uniref:Uncharacterized protein n=1 Tax=Haloferax prahovense (strain DSM 18310 / JCM 13924 / TL6) TaxID=1227461 RepID=M0G4C7_HALPT|nr:MULTISPECIES: hypothetical protein [Haloferax]ELZ66417.1 hypothetical protein C457_14763 [Haloferax prahovense DSM 18310]RDZ48052.1 hypothetical protein C5B86_03055 [Haloferax sp. Atlit-19N]